MTRRELEELVQEAYDMGYNAAMESMNEVEDELDPIEEAYIDGYMMAMEGYFKDKYFKRKSNRNDMIVKLENAQEEYYKYAKKYYDLIDKQIKGKVEITKEKLQERKAMKDQVDKLKKNLEEIKKEYKACNFD